MVKKQTNTIRNSDEQFKKQQNRLELQLNGEHAQGWSKVSQDQYLFKEYKDATRKAQSQPNSMSSSKKSQMSLELLEHHHAKMDY